MDLDNQYYVNQYNLFYKHFNKNEYFARGSGVLTSKRDTDYISKNLLKNFPPPPEQKINILDSGCGSGLISLPYINLDNVNKIYLIDSSSEAIKIINKNIHKLKNSKKIITKTQSCFQKIDTELNFDVIIIYSVIHYFNKCSDLEKLINTYAKQLNRNGIIIIGDVPMKKIVLKQKFYIFIFVKNLLINFFKLNINFFFRNLINICEFILRKYNFHRLNPIKWCFIFSLRIFYKILFKIYNKKINKDKFKKENQNSYNKNDMLDYSNYYFDFKKKFKNLEIKIKYQDFNYHYPYERADIIIKNLTNLCSSHIV